MTATTETRKRSREDDSCDSMPLSKRINNLHINNGIHSDFNQTSCLGHSSNHQVNQHHNHHQMRDEYKNLHAQDNGFVSQIVEGNNSQDALHTVCYSPDLNQHENPYYYNKNKLLYELHLERMRRTQP